MTNLSRRNDRDPINTMFERFLSEPFFVQEFPAAIQRIEEGTLALDVSEDNTSVLVRASLPGFRREDVDIEVHDGVLTIKAQYNEEHEEKNERYYRKERRTGSVSRRIALPALVQETGGQAELKDAS